MKESDLEEFEDLWTTNRDRCVLANNRGQTYANGQKRGFSIFQSNEGQLCAVLIEDSQLKEIVVQRMLDAGVKVVSDVKAARALFVL
jgi:hypothetical protein